MKNIKISIIIASTLVLAACGVVNEKNKGKGINLFSIEQDMELGAQVAAQIDADTAQFPLLDTAKYKDVYKYVNDVRDKILNSGQVDYKEEFKWRVRIIQDDSTLNAFCTPGGYIYVYTGILKFLDSEEQLAGVLGHEIGHADMRHSTRQMSQMLGVQVLLSAVLGDQSALGQVTGALIGLKFSRKHETEADGRSVKYLCPTDYHADAGAGFFQKITNMGGGRPPEFLSTHPNPDDRIENFQTLALTSGCLGDKDYKAEYATMVKKLP